MLYMYVYVHISVVSCFFQKALHLVGFSEIYLDAVGLSGEQSELPLCVSGGAWMQTRHPPAELLGPVLRSPRFSGHTVYGVTSILGNILAFQRFPESCTPLLWVISMSPHQYMISHLISSHHS